MEESRGEKKCDFLNYIGDSNYIYKLNKKKCEDLMIYILFHLLKCLFKNLEMIDEMIYFHCEIICETQNINVSNMNVHYVEILRKIMKKIVL